MSAEPDDYSRALKRAHHHAEQWLTSVPSREVRPQLTADQLATQFDEPFNEDGADPADVVGQLVRRVEPGLMAMPSGRFFGWVIGGTLPARRVYAWRRRLREDFKESPDAVASVVDDLVPTRRWAWASDAAEDSGCSWAQLSPSAC